MLLPEGFEVHFLTRGVGSVSVVFSHNCSHLLSSCRLGSGPSVVSSTLLQQVEEAQVQSLGVNKMSPGCYLCPDLP